MWESDMRDDTGKHELIGNIGNIVNQSRMKIPPNLNIYFNELIHFLKPFVTSIVRDNTGFFKRYHNINVYKISMCYFKKNSTVSSCGIVEGK